MLTNSTNLLPTEIHTTQDGSKTIYIPDWDESYHSKHGALQEARHVFLKNGLDLCTFKTVHVLEIGLGTGLNAIVTYQRALETGKTIFYTGVEAYPLDWKTIEQLQYNDFLTANESDIFTQIHQTGWEMPQLIDAFFTLTKHKNHFQEIDYTSAFDIIYFDAFGYRVQPELWSEAIFAKMYQALKPGGILTTYACRSVIKKAMEACGFSVCKLPGAPGKREMILAKKG